MHHKNSAIIKRSTTPILGVHLDTRIFIYFTLQIFHEQVVKLYFDNFKITKFEFKFQINYRIHSVIKQYFVMCIVFAGISVPTSNKAYY